MMLPTVEITNVGDGVMERNGIWNTGGIILIGENQSTQRKYVPVPLGPPPVQNGLAWDQTQPPAWEAGE